VRNSSAADDDGAMGVEDVRFATVVDLGARGVDAVALEDEAAAVAAWSPLRVLILLVIFRRFAGCEELRD
jgi:hypothetical protein